MPFAIHVEDVPQRFECQPGQSALAAVRNAGSSAVDVGCRSGGCGVCRVQVIEGDFETGTMSAAEITPADRSNGIVLACQLFPLSDVHLRAMGRGRTSRQDDTAALLRRLCAARPEAAGFAA